MALGEWPTLAEMKLSIDQSSVTSDELLERHLAAAIEITKLKVGDWDEVVDEPSERLAQHALTLAIRIAAEPSQAPRVLARDAGLEALLLGERNRFPMA